jgi:hypothetical protein
MAQHEDLATLWSFIGGLRCVLRRVGDGWQIRIDAGRETLRSYTGTDSREVQAVADQWLKECEGGTLPGRTPAA